MPPLPFVELLNHLFETRLRPDGQPYNLREVAEGTGGKVTSGYLSLLRRGGITMPSADKVQALADFFEVDVGYFFGRQQLPEERHSIVDGAVLEALGKPGARDLLLRASALGEEEIAYVLRLLEQTQALVDRARSQGQGRQGEAGDRTRMEQDGDAE